jgi:hypothetical protein
MSKRSSVSSILMALAKYIKILIQFLALPQTEDWQHADATANMSIHGW